MQSFVKSQAFLDDPTKLVYRLEEHSGSLLPFSDLLLAMCERFVGPLRDAGRDPSQSIMFDLSHFLPLLIRLYEQANEQRDTQIADQCLDAFDAMFMRRIGAIHELAQAMG